MVGGVETPCWIGLGEDDFGVVVFWMFILAREGI